MSDDFGPVLQKPALNLKLEGLQPMETLHVTPLGIFSHGVEVLADAFEKKPEMHAHLDVVSSICELAPQLSRHDVWPVFGWTLPVGHELQEV